MNAADTFFVLMSAALVMLMTPALGLFYGGMVRTKNVLGTIMHSFIILALISIEWVLWGALATGLFASKAINPSGANGLFFGNPSQLFIQFVSVIVSIAFSFVMALIILKVVDKLVGLRVTDEEEEAGLDVSMHSETGYSF